MIMSKNCENCGKEFIKLSSESKKYWSLKRFCSIKCSGTLIRNGEKLPESWRQKMQGRTAWNKGKKQPLKEKHPNWKGGNVSLICKQCGASFLVRPYRKDSAKFCSTTCKKKSQDFGRTSHNEKIRKSKAYKIWRSLVFKRDNYTCVLCGVRGGKLHADHIKPFALYSELQLDINNGRTLCTGCHKQTPTYGRQGIFRKLPKTDTNNVVAYSKGF